MDRPTGNVSIRTATQADLKFVIQLMDVALKPYYGGDHRVHALRIFQTHISGGKDQIGHFSSEQNMVIIEVSNDSAGQLELVGKRKGTDKISQLNVAPEYGGRTGHGSVLLACAVAQGSQYEGPQE